MKGDELLKHLNDNSDPFEELSCEHQKRMKVIEIPITNGELNYTELLANVQKIINKVNGFGWSELLVCIDPNAGGANNTAIMIGYYDHKSRDHVVCFPQTGMGIGDGGGNNNSN